MIRSTLLKATALTMTVALLGSLSVLCGQTANTKPPQPKSQKELDALQAMFGAYQSQNWDGVISSSKELVTKFADSEFKATAFQMSAESYRNKGDAENAIVNAEQCLAADPKYYAAMILIAGIQAQRTREFDLDKEEKLGRAEKLANEAIGIVKTAQKFNPQIPDEQWEQVKKSYLSQAYEALGMAGMVRKKYDVCVTNLTLSLDAPMADPATFVRLASCLKEQKKYDEALTYLDKALADAQAAPIIKQAATQEKMAINKLKAGQ
jgi:tetratricopeptide (TPR) repeat protein